MKKLVSTDFSAENWLILGKKWSMMIATADKYGCRTLPMRNWHNLPPVTWATNKTSSDITYEELTHAVTHFLQHSYDQEPAGRTLPMRNWHAVHKHLPLYHSALMSDITYEELTQASAGKKHSPRKLSDITYEELTPVSGLKFLGT